MNKNVKIAKKLVRLAKSLIAGDESSLTDEEITQINMNVDVPFAVTDNSFERNLYNSCKMNMGFVLKDVPDFMKEKDDYVLITKENGKFIAKLFWFYKGKFHEVDIAETNSIEDMGKEFDKKETTRTFGQIYDPDGLDTRW